MKRSIHSLMGASIGLILAWNNPFIIFTNILFGWIGGYFPDIDLKLKHRKSLHNLFAIGTATVIIYITTRLVFLNLNNIDIDYAVMISRYSAASFLLGALAHIFFDSFTPRGVYILWPISSFRVKIGLFRSNSKLYNGIGLLISLTMFLIWIVFPYGLGRIMGIT